MRRITSRAVLTFGATIALAVATSCGGSGSTSTATSAPETTAQRTSTTTTTTTTPPTTAAPTSTTERSTTTTDATRNIFLQWADTSGFAEGFDELTHTIGAFATESSGDDVAAFSEACQAVHDANAALVDMLPSPEPELDAAVMAMVEDWDAGMHVCVDALAAEDTDQFAELPALVEQASGHLYSINSIVSNILDGSPFGVGEAAITELAASFGCTDVTMGTPPGGALAAANCTFMGEQLLLATYAGTPDSMMTTGFCDGNAGKALSLVVGPTWIIVAGEHFEELLDALKAEYGDEISVTVLAC